MKITYLLFNHTYRVILLQNDNYYKNYDLELWFKIDIVMIFFIKMFETEIFVICTTHKSGHQVFGIYFSFLKKQKFDAFLNIRF